MGSGLEVGVAGRRDRSHPQARHEVAIGSNGYGGVASFTRTPEDPMTDDRLPLAELLAKAGDGDFLRSVAEAVVQLLMAWGEPWPKAA